MVTNSKYLKSVIVEFMSKTFKVQAAEDWFLLLIALTVAMHLLVSVLNFYFCGAIATNLLPKKNLKLQQKALPHLKVLSCHV